MLAYEKRRLRDEEKEITIQQGQQGNPHEDSKYDNNC